MITQLRNKAAVILSLAVVAGATLSGVVTAAATPSTLSAGQSLAVNGKLLSADSGMRLSVQNDGNLVLYNRNLVAVWSSKTSGSGTNNRLTMQSDGNLVLYTAANVAVWSAKTSGKGNFASVQNGGNFAVFNSASKALWTSATAGQEGSFVPECTAAGTTTGTALSNTIYNYSYPSPPNYVLIDNSAGSQLCQLTSADKLHRAVLQADGNFVVYNGAGKATWSSGTKAQPGSTGQWVQIDTDGILSMGGVATGQYDIFQSNPSNPGVRLTMQNDGNLVFATASGAVVWSSNTAGK